MRSFFKPVQYAQPYTTSNIPVHRLDEEYIENPFSHQQIPSNSNANIQNNAQQMQANRFQNEIASRKKTLVISGVLVLIFLILVSAVYYAFPSSKSVQSQLQSNLTTGK